MKRRTALAICAAVAFAVMPLPAQKSVSDDTLYDSVRRKLAGDPVVKGGALDVDVKAGVVTLRGKLETEKQKARAEKIARKVSGVKQVVNQIEVSQRGAR